MSFLPSAMATATMLHVFKAMEEPHCSVDYHSQLLNILGIDKVCIYHSTYNPNCQIQQINGFNKIITKSTKFSFFFSKQGNVEECCKLISNASRRNGNQFNKRKFGLSIPGSPNGVMDVAFSSDSSNDSWSVASSVSSSPEPLTKKNRVNGSVTGDCETFRTLS